MSPLLQGFATTPRQQMRATNGVFLSAKGIEQH